MGIDGQVIVPTYTLKDGQLYVNAMGGLQPMQTGDAERRREQHRHEATFFARAEPERAAENARLGDELDALLKEQAGI